LKRSLDLETQHAIRRRKEIKPIPSPFGEGQTDTPINHANQGEVSAKMPIAESPLVQHPVGKWREAKAAMNRNFASETHHNHQPTSPLPIWEGRGDRSLDTPINHVSQGEVPLQKNKSFKRTVVHL
jgi:hypothetical protein